MPDLASSLVSIPPVNPSLFLASSLFAEVASLSRLPADCVYADCLIVAAFNHLSAGVRGTLDAGAMNACAENIERCSYLSEAVRTHVGGTLRGVADRTTGVALALNIIASAAARHAHQLMLDAASAIGNGGLGNLADTLADAIDGLAEAMTATKH